MTDQTEEISSATSRKAAERILNEIAVAGSYQADRRENGYTVFVKSKEGKKEELTIREVNDRSYKIIRKHLGLDN